MAAELLLIDADTARSARLAELLTRARYRVSHVSAPEHPAAGGAPDLVVFALPEGGEVPAFPALPDGVPLLVIDDGAQTRRRLVALRGGARDVVQSTPGPLLLAQVRRLLREGDTQRELRRRRRAALELGLREDPSGFAHQRRLAFIDTGEATPLAVARLPRKAAILTADQALDGSLPGTPPELYILDASGGDAAEVIGLLPDLRARAHSRHAAKLVMYRPGDTHTAVAALNLGASDLMMSDGSVDELEFRINALLARKDDQDSLRRSTETSFRLAATDPLTGLYNRRYANAYLHDALAQARREGHAVSVMLLDVDHFKRVNDQHGHPVGDAVLVEVARRLRENLRGSDLIARWGGEEFLIVMPDTEASRAGPAADRLRQLVGDTPVSVDGLRIPATISVGVAIGRPAEQETTAGALEREADAALYRAKTGGRNRVEAPAAA